MLEKSAGAGVRQTLELGDHLTLVGIADPRSDHGQQDVRAACIVAVRVGLFRKRNDLRERIVRPQSETAQHELLDAVWILRGIGRRHGCAPAAACERQPPLRRGGLEHRINDRELLANADLGRTGQDFTAAHAGHVEHDDREARGKATRDGAPDSHGLECAADAEQYVLLITVAAIGHAKAALFDDALHGLHVYSALISAAARAAAHASFHAYQASGAILFAMRSAGEVSSRRRAPSRRSRQSGLLARSETPIPASR